MRVDEPKFDYTGLVSCDHCPFTPSNPGKLFISAKYKKLCGDWLRNHTRICPTAETYAEAVRLADEAAKGAKC